MALPFSQSMHSLQTDRTTPTLIWIGAALVLAVAWLAWFFFAPITRYETGTIIGLTREGRPIAQLPSYAYLSIQQGQPAYIHLQPSENEPVYPGGSAANGNQSRVLPAVVANILEPPDNEHFIISLSLQPGVHLPPLRAADLRGEVAIEIESISPARLVAHASGQFIDTPTLSFSPQ